MAWNYVDLFLLFTIALHAFRGWRQGFVHRTFDLARWIGSLLIGLRMYKSVAAVVGPHLGWLQAWERPVSFFLTVAGANLVIYLIGRQLLKQLPETLPKSRANRLLGLAPGVVNGVIVAAILSSLALAAPLPDSLLSPVRDSKVANELAVVADRIEETFGPLLSDTLQGTLNLQTIPPDAETGVTLPFKIEQTTPRPDLEAEMLKLLNRERVNNDLPPLIADPALADIARRHAIDMFARGYFSHTTPEGRGPDDRMGDSGVRFLKAGENLAIAPTLTLAHSGLMNSPGHRANILNPSFSRVGVAVIDGGKYGLMVTQVFRN